MTDNDLDALNFLVVDDQPTNLAMVDALLCSLGASNIVCAKSGSEAVAKLARAHRPMDCPLADFRMPNGNGLQLLKALRTGMVP